MHHIRLWLYDSILASSVAGPIDVFTAANTLWAEKNRRKPGAAPLFKWRLESPDGKPVSTASGQLLHVDGAINARSAADAVIVPGPFVGDMARFVDRLHTLQPLLLALRRQHERGALLASCCTGSFLLAEAGLLDGQVATTHWAKAKAFETRYPRVHLRAAEILTEQNRILCSGAVTSSLNLALRLVEIFAGTGIAAATAKLFLIDINRTSQAPYATLPNEQKHSDLLVAKAQLWMEAHLREGFRLADLAAHLAVSERTLNRRFKHATGETPLRYLQALRIEIAKRLIETESRLGIDAVSERVGYDDPGSFRQLFKRETGLSPREYQCRFARRDEAATV